LRILDTMGRPPIKPKEFRNGFYIEVCNKGTKNGIKIIRDTKEEMLKAIKEYEKTKDIIVLGEFKNGKWLSDPKRHEA
jgi:hypothetical protein